MVARASTSFQRIMVTQFIRDNAFWIVCSGLASGGVSVWNVIQRPRNADDSPWADVVFLGINWTFAAILCFIGGRHLREMKKAHADESWLKFLRYELITMVVAAALIAGVAAMPEAWLKAAWDFFHEVELVRMLARGGH